MFLKFYKIFNYSTIAIVALFLILMLSNAVSKDSYKPLLYVTIGILVARIALRIYLHSYLKKNIKGE